MFVGRANADHICVGPDGRPIPCPPEGDLALISVKAIQAPADPNVLAAGKYTMAQIELENTFHGDLTNVPFRLDKTSCNVTTICTESFPCCVFGSIPVVHHGRDTYFIGPVQPDNSPQSHSVICLNPRIDPGNTIAEVNELNNGGSDCKGVVSTKPLSVLYIPIAMREDHGIQLTQDEINNFVSESDKFLKGTWPLAENGYSSKTDPPTGTTDIYPDSCRNIPNVIGKFQCMIREVRGNYDRVVAIVREGWFRDHGIGTGVVGGVGSHPDSPNSMVDPWAIVEGKAPYREGQDAPAANIVSHELAHTYAWVPSGDPLECPFPPDQPELRGHLCNPTLGGGYWVAQGTKISPVNDFSVEASGLQNICCDHGIFNSWITRATFNYLIDRLKVNTADSAVILVTGQILDNGTTVNYPWLKMIGTPDIPLNNPGKLTITYLDNAGHQLAKTGFDFNFIPPPNPKLHFSPGLSLRIPDVQGTHRVVISNNSKVLFERTFSSHAPTVKILSPTDGTAVKPGGTVNVVWNASDPDVGDKLTYSVSQSSDYGETWSVLSSGLTEKKFSFVIPSVTFSSNSNSSSLVIRVTANDGINTSTDHVCIEIKNQPKVGCHPYSVSAQFGSQGTGDGQFSNITSIAVDNTSNVNVADPGSHHVQQFTKDGNFITKLDTPIPWAIATDRLGNVYMTDISNSVVKKFTSDGVFVRKWGGFGTNGSGIDQFNQPEAIAVDPSSKFVYVADGNQRVQKFDSNGKFITKWGTKGTENGQFNGNPQGLATDSSGNVYVADTLNFRVQKFDRDGKFITKWGKEGTGNGEFGTSRNNAGPHGIAVDHEGNVYVADPGNNRIQKFSTDGRFIALWGSYGTGDGQLNQPKAVAIDGFGNVYVADSGNHRIQIFFVPQY